MSEANDRAIPIVVVDDAEIDRYLVHRIVKKTGIDGKVIEFVDGDDFVAAVMDDEKRAKEIGQPPPPALVLLDINMPRMSGFEVLRMIEEQAGEDAKGCMVVMMFSSSSYAEDQKEAYSYGFVKDYIVKPLTEERLQDIVARHF